MKLNTFKILLIALMVLLNSVCSKKKQIIRAKKPPVSYQSTALGFRNKISTKLGNDSLGILSRPYTSGDPSIKLDFIFSIIEIYDRRDSLLHRLTKSATDTNEVVQDYWLYPFKEDTCTIRSWGFGYVLRDDKETIFDSKKLYFGTTPMEITKIPFPLSEAEIAIMDSVKKTKSSND